MKELTVAVIGCGVIANAFHIPNYLKLEGVKIKYFCDIIPEKAAAAVEKYGCGIAVTDYHDILGDAEVDAVSVCTPNKMHMPISVDFLHAGKDVLCEKPAARSYEEAKLMLDAQRETGKILVIGVVNRFNNGVRAIKKLIESGELGEIYHIYASFRRYRGIPGLGGAFTTRDISGGGALIDIGVHAFDKIMYCVGDPAPLSVSGQTYSKLGADMENYVYESMWSEVTKDLNGTFDVDDFVTGFIRTSGPTITFNGAWAQNIGASEDFTDFLGTEGGVRLNGNDITVYTVKDKKLFNYKLEFEPNDMFYDEISSFIGAVRGGDPLPSCIERNILTSKLMSAVYESAETGREVTL